MPPIDVLPPPNPQTITRSRQIGLGLCAVAALLGAIASALSDASFLNTPRIWLCFIGAVVAGSALSLKSTCWKSWLWASATMVLARFGFPSHWDSFQFLTTVLAAICLAGAVLAYLPLAVRSGVAIVFFIFHFGGILTATTWPHPTPWITDQLGHRVYQPYLKFMYLMNAYHFYSPDPGPASHLYFLVKSQTNEIDPNTKKPIEILEWVTIPTRPEQIKDPLALTYYRRLAISEQCAMATPDAFTPQTFEKSEVYARRMEVLNGLRPGYPRIPIAPPEIEPWGVQYKVPAPRITTYILPSYVRHIVAHHSTEKQKVVMVRVYRLEHRIMTPAMMAKSDLDPYHPTTYRPYFLGDFDANGGLIDPQDPMLYWLIPILNKPGGATPGDPKKKDFEDYLEKHAGAVLEWRRP
ncbi:MAG: hypothetical protein U0798_20020 [Gemmataceae bacterium]